MLITSSMPKTARTVVAPRTPTTARSAETLKVSTRPMPRAEQGEDQQHNPGCEVGHVAGDDAEALGATVDDLRVAFRFGEDRGGVAAGIEGFGVVDEGAAIGAIEDARRGGPFKAGHAEGDGRRLGR